MSRKLLTLVLSSLFVVSFGLNASAQPSDVKVELTSGPPLFVDDINGLDAKLGLNQTYGFTVQSKVNSGGGEDGATIGFSVYSPDGSISNLGVANAAMSADWASASVYWTLGGGLLSLDIDGTLPEGMLTGGAKLSGNGFDASTFVDVMFFDIVIGSDSGVFCIDSAFFPPSGEWLYTTNGAPNLTAGGGDGAVGGSSPTALCYTTFTIPDLPPVVTNCAVAPVTNHCDAYNTTVTMNDPDPENDPITYTGSHDGTGTLTVDAGSGAVQYVPGAGEVGTVTITVNGAEQGTSPSSDCVILLDVQNTPPALVCPPNVATAKGKSNTSPAANGSDADACDVLVYSLGTVTPTPTGTVSVDPTTGAVTFASDISDAVGGVDTPYDIEVIVSDGNASANCTMTFTVLNTEAFCVSIDQTDKTDPAGGSLQGHQVEVCINFDAGSNEVGGFDFLIQYDNSALSFVGATEGNIFPDYEWEYFTYRFGPNGNCTGGCPSGKLRVIGIAEANDGMHHPNNTKLVAGDQFACLTFLVSNDRNLECQYVPIRWCWVDCGDNSLSSSGGDTLYISRDVFDYIGTDMANVVSGFRAQITGADQSFPTLTGAPDVCDVFTEKGAPERFVDFKNGGIKIICADSIDARGDINLNGLSNEIADATMLTNYFVSGLSAFGSHIEGSRAASEVNGDGIPATVADLVYLIRVIVGDALPLPKLSHNAEAITISANNGVVSSSADMGAALFTFAGEVDVTLLANNMEIKTGVVDGNTRVLVYSMEKESIASGSVLSTNGTLVSVEAADYNGVALSPGLDINKPTSFAVHQNYPNPFNPNTKISFDLTDASEYSVRIYNVAGQLVREITGEGQVGTVELDVDMNGNASGIYFYNVKAGAKSETRKMVLLK